MAERLTAIVDADVGGFVRGMNRVDQRLGSTSSRMNAIGRTAGTFGKTAALGAVGAAAGLGLVAVAAGKIGIGYASARQQALVSFKVMLGSAQKAKTMLRDLERFAAKTPFEMSDLQVAAQRMLALGWNAKKLLPDLRIIGDAAAASPQGMVEGMNRITMALGQMKSKGKASAEEIMQLAEAGIPAWKYLAKAAGVSVADMQKQVTKGAVSADFAVGAILGGMKQKFGGMMREQSKTLAGSWSTLKDTITQGLGTALQPLIPMLTNASQKLSDFLGSADGKNAMKSLGDGVRTVVEKLGDLGGWVVDHKDDFKAIGDAIVTAFQKGAGAVEWLGNALGKIDLQAFIDPIKEIAGVLDAVGFDEVFITPLVKTGELIGDLVGPLGDAKAKTLDVAAAWDQVKQHALEANRTIVNLATTTGQRNQAREDVAAARKQIAGAKNEQERIAGVRALSEAQMRLITLNRQLRDENAKSVHEEAQGVLTAIAARARYATEVEDHQRKLAGLREGERAQIERVKQAEATGNENTIKQEKDKLARIKEAQAAEQQALAESMKNRDQATVNYQKAVGRATAMDVARNRALAEQVPLGERASAAISRLGRGYASAGKAGQEAAAGLTRIASSGKTTDAQVQKIAALTGKAKELGRTKAALKITAESKTADEAIKKLDRLVKAPKRTNIALEVSGVKKLDWVVAAYPKLRKGVKADATIRVAGDDELRTALNHVDVLKGRNGQTTHVYIVTHERNAKAMGGQVPAAARGGRYAAPTYLVGEAGYPEWVIPTDPKYRTRARAFLSAAAKDVGVPGFKKGGLALTTHVPWAKFGKWGLDRQEKLYQRYEADTGIFQRQWERSGDGTGPGEYGMLAGRLKVQKRMAVALRAHYARSMKGIDAKIGKLGAKPSDPDAAQKWEDKRRALLDRKRDLADRFSSMRQTILGLTEDIADAMASQAKAKDERDKAAAEKKAQDALAGGAVGDLAVPGLKGLDEQIAIARAGLGGNLVELLTKRKAMLDAAFAGAKTQAEKAALAPEVKSTADDLKQAIQDAKDAGTPGAATDTGTASSAGGGGGGGGPTNVTNTLNLYVDGSVATEQDLAQAMRKILIEWGRSNGTPIFAGYA